MAARLTIYYTSDTHGYLFPTNYADGQVRQMGLLCAAKRMNKGENALLLDGGDTIQGSPLARYCHAGGVKSPVARVMRAMGYDYITLGNHDFNYGYDELEQDLQDCGAVCLCANVRDRRGRLPIAPYAVRALENGLRVGLVGVTTNWVKRWEKPDRIVNFGIGDPFVAAKEALSALKGQVDLTVCIYHGGFEKDLATGRRLSNNDENIGCRLAEELSFDILLGGHQHLAVPGRLYAGTHVVQTPSKATQFAVIEVDEAGRITSRLEDAGGEMDPALQALAQPVEEKVQAWLEKPIARLTRPLRPKDKLDRAMNGSPIANLFNQAQIAATGADISCCSLANDIKGLGRAVSVRDVISTYVYPNKLVVLEITGAKLKAALERCAAYFDVRSGRVAIADEFLRPKAAHYNYDFYYGLFYAFDLRRPAGARVSSMRLKGHAIAPDEKLTLCLSNYRAAGGGGYAMYADCPRVLETQGEISELLLDYLAERGHVEVDARPPFIIMK